VGGGIKQLPDLISCHRPPNTSPTCPGYSRRKLPSTIKDEGVDSKSHSVNISKVVKTHPIIAGKHDPTISGKQWLAIDILEYFVLLS
jgi:hypothetical protein